MGRRGIVVLFTIVTILVTILLGCQAPPVGSAEWHFERAYKLAGDGNCDEAILEYTKAIAVEPNMAAAYINRGAAYASNKQYTLTIADCTKAIELNPTLPMAYVNRAYAYNATGEYILAIDDCNKAIELVPDLTAAYVNRAYAYQGNKQYSLSIDDCNKAMELAPEIAQPYYHRGLAYKGQGRKNEAIADFIEFRERNLDPELDEKAMKEIRELSK